MTPRTHAFFKGERAAMSFGVQGVNNSLGTAQQGDGSSSMRPFANLNLTSDQRSEIRSILSNAKSQGTSEAQVQTQINAVLTPQQQQTLQTDQQQGQGTQAGHHHHHHHGGGGSSSTSSTTSATSTTSTDPWDPDQTTS
jgi:Spy/CpxP family protein refolding chaperone